MTGVTPSGSGSRASHEAAKASSPEASIPNAAFTPGPWELRGLTVFERGKTGIAIAVATQHEPNAKANAHLMKAAPDLYEQCSDALAWFEENGCGGGRVLRLRAALAKARGDQ